MCLISVLPHEKLSCWLHYIKVCSNPVSSLPIQPLGCPSDADFYGQSNLVVLLLEPAASPQSLRDFFLYHLISSASTQRPSLSVENTGLLFK